MRLGRSSTALALVAVVAIIAPAGVAGEPPPETVITSGPDGPSRDPTPTFSFSSDRPDSEFECRLDGGTWTLGARSPGAFGSHLFNPGWGGCSSPTSYEHLADGEHLFEVRALAPGGPADPTPATRSFSLDTSVGGETRARPRQRQRGRRVAVELEVAASERLLVRARGAINVRRRGPGRRAYKLEGRTVELAAGQARTLRLHPLRRAHKRRIVSALRRGRRAEARLRVKLTNEPGNSVRSWPTVLLRRAR